MSKRNGGNGRNRPRPVLDEGTKRRREIIAKAKKMSADELVQIAVRAGILTEDQELAAPYRDDVEPSACRPTD